MGKRVRRIRTTVSEPQMAQAIIGAWKELFGVPPAKEQVSMVLAQNALETGNRKSMWNYNVGNITTDGNGTYDFFDDLTTNEQINPGVWKKINLKYRAYPSLEEGTKDYLRLLSGGHYTQAWKHILDPDPVAFSKSLKAGGYYTANEEPYTKALTSLFNQTSKSKSYELAMAGKVRPTEKFPSSMIAKLEPTSFWGMLEKYVRMLGSYASDIPLKSIYKYALPNHNVLIKIDAPNYTSAVEFSRVLCTALDEDLLSTSYPHTDGRQVEVECSISGPAPECFAAVEQMSQAIAEVFKDATIKIGGITIKTICLMDKKSSYQPISLETSSTNYRKFLLKFAQQQGK